MISDVLTAVTVIIAILWVLCVVVMRLCLPDGYDRPLAILVTSVAVFAVLIGLLVFDMAVI